VLTIQHSRQVVPVKKSVPVNRKKPIKK